VSTPALAVITLPGGDSTLDGAFGPVQYGPTGAGTAFAAPLLFVSQFANTVPPATQVLGTDLTYAYSPSGLGTSQFLVDYTIANTSSTDTFTDLRFIVNVEPSGPVSFMDTVEQSWAAQSPGDPDARQIASYNPVNPLLNQAQSNNGLVNGNDECAAAACDADFALQWNRAQLQPGESWTVQLVLSDDSGTPATARYLRAISVNDPATMLTVSAVPEPRTYLLFALGLGLVTVLTRRTVRLA